MTESDVSGNQPVMLAVAHSEPFRAPEFEEVYESMFDFVSVSMRRLGVPSANLDDAVQEAFIVVHRRLHEFEGRSSLKTWLTRIAVNVAADARRLIKRKGGHEPLHEALVDSKARDPLQSVEHTQEIERLYRVLAKVDDDHRTVFVLIELEQLTAPEVAEVLQLKLNTVYSRLRVARERFQAALEIDLQEAP